MRAVTTKIKSDIETLLKQEQRKYLNNDFVKENLSICEPVCNSNLAF